MAKKEDNKTTDKTKKTTATGTKGKAASKKTTTPKESGEVKGPGIAEKRQNSSTTAMEKGASKVNQPAKGRFEDTDKSKKTTGKSAKAEGGKTKASTPKKAVPKKTSATAKKNTAAKKAAKFKDPVIDEQVADKAAPASKQTSATRKTSSEEKKKPVAKKATKSSTTAAKSKKSSTKATSEGKTPAKKMSRRKMDKDISAEEKAKKPNTSTTEDLTASAKKKAKDFADQVLPEEKDREQIQEMAKSILPDQETIKDTAKKIAKSIAPDPDMVDKAVDKVLPEEKEKAKEKVKKTSKKATSGTTSKKDKEKSSRGKPVEATLLTEFDIHLFREGKHFHLYEKLGSHLMEYMGTEGVYFALWAPNAKHVSVIGNFNQWDKQAHPMKPRQDNSGIWEAFIPDAKKGSLYKYFIQSTNGYEVEKGDPYAFMWETPPQTASVVWDLENTWKDKKWMQERKKKMKEPQPVSVYELHVGSWKRVPEEEMRSLSYRELAEELPAYLKEMGFTHVEFMPVMEHPFFGSWGYQVTGYFAPSSRFGTPQDFMYLIESLHEAGIGVILDWVPSHFPSDMHGLHYFDGTFLYEHADPRKGFHPDWQSYIFNYGRNEVRSFLISNAVYWLDKFHADGLRVDAVASMLYLDYSRKEGEWEPNEHGGNENLEAISFLKEFNEVVYSEFPDIMTIAEESTAWPMVSKPTYMGGLGFGMKWMMGWMHDTLEYFQKDPIHRKHHQNTITFSTTYAFTENFMLPLSHDEVVYGKQAIFNKMPGDDWNKFANLRSLYSYMYAHPGTKLLFMGAEFAQTTEWNHDSSLDWHKTNEAPHQQVQETLKKLNKIYSSEPAFYEKAFDSEGFEWIDINDSESSVISFIRKGNNPDDTILVVCNLTPVPRENYRIGVPSEGTWTEIFNSDDEQFGGSNVKNAEGVEAEPLQTHHKNHSVSLTLPPMGVVYLKKK
ncbi:1,4-alpha-glucan branching protein GlgB [Salinimicrobium sp. GXAS 041]|uniref:1,4-alpha-glucan branching protein GlgB n=1 Tax=Salinimicrobium sp. GXAS 041 TaxID=3400806 RepID=UPI003C725E55